MDAFLIALLGCLLGEVGDKSQWLTLALATRYNRDRSVIAGIVAAAVANAVLSAMAGAWIGPMMGGDARLLFMALSILFLGVGLWFKVSKPDLLESWPIGPFLTTALGLFILEFGDGPQFLILGIATRTADPVLAGVGGALGVMAGLVPMVLLRRPLADLLPVRAIRYAGGLALVFTGIIMGMVATGLV